jgi:hypothetical protein
MNYMPGGAHYTLGQTIESEKWEANFIKIHAELSLLHEVIVICHSAGEVLAIRKLVPTARTFFSPRPEDYLNVLSQARFGIVNRVHAGVALAGFGRPAVVVGNDSRAGMAELLGLPVVFVNNATPAVLLEHIESFHQNPEDWSHRLLTVKEEARLQYLGLLQESIGPLLNSLKDRKGYGRSDSDSVRPDFFSPY